MEEEKSNDKSREEEILGSSLTMEKVAAAKKYIENHYKNQMKSIQERKERYASKWDGESFGFTVLHILCFENAAQLRELIVFQLR